MYSRTACWLICLCLLAGRLYYSGFNTAGTVQNPLMMTTFDALGYYLYLPGCIIYNDVTDLRWFPAVNQRYQIADENNFYQVIRQKSGKHIFKYAGGVALLELPFFLIAHIGAPALGYPADGFSPPYQYALAFGMILWACLGLWILRSVLRRYFDDRTVALTLALLILASNAIQYISVDTAQSHAWIFTLYAMVLYATMRWHEARQIPWAFAVGLLIGLATMSRPTEAIMLFIPLLWGAHTPEASKEKWRFLKNNPAHVAAVIVGGAIGFFPQMAYWKIATGSFWYTMGSKWQFLNPWFRVLFGWEKGWFVYTPVTLLFVAGLFFLRQYPFRKSALTFCLLNIYIIISWSDWRYGGSYAARALMHSYPVFALAFAALIQRGARGRWHWLWYPLSVWLMGVNIFQIWQYNRTIIHYDHMNRAYYARVYLNPDPTPLDMSLLDTPEWLPERQRGQAKTLTDTAIGVAAIQPAENSGTNRLILKTLPVLSAAPHDRWLMIEAEIDTRKGFWHANLGAAFSGVAPEKTAAVRLFSPISTAGQINSYAFFFRIPAGAAAGDVSLFIAASQAFEADVGRLKVTAINWEGQKK
jgi:Dolichyl-phosphate-mannose-protein mannosyltransferase